jgi:hypothetical protein
MRGNEDTQVNWFRSLFNNFWDQMLVLGVAVLVCVLGVASFWLADVYHMNEVWIFFALNSILLIPLFAKRFRGHWKRPAFLLFFAGWMAVHGLIILGLMRWVPFLYWPIFILLELMAAFQFASWLFGISPYIQEE